MIRTIVLLTSLALCTSLQALPSTYFYGGDVHPRDPSIESTFTVFGGNVEGTFPTTTFRTDGDVLIMTIAFGNDLFVGSIFGIGDDPAFGPADTSDGNYISASVSFSSRATEWDFMF